MLILAGLNGYVATVTGTTPSEDTRVRPPLTTQERVSEAALVRFADQGVAATSLDDLARSIGLTKQTVLYHFGSKDGLVRAVARRGAAELAAVLSNASASSDPGWNRVEAIVRAAFGLAVQRPELLSLMREVSRLGGPISEAVLADLKPLIDGALDALADGMATGVFRTADPRLILVAAYAAVAGVVTDTEALRAVGLELDVRVAARLRRTVLDFLASSLLPDSSRG